MISPERAQTSHEFHFDNGNPNLSCATSYGLTADGHSARVRRNGRTKTWKTRPGPFRIPVKFGIQASGQFSIWHTNAHNWHAAEDCPNATR